MNKEIKNTIRVGVQHKNAYPERRNIINIVSNAEYLEIEDVYKRRISFKNKLRSYSKLKKLLGKLIRQTSKERYSFKLKKKHKNIDFFHFFNTICIDAKQPWGVTFETLIPCFDNFLLFHKSADVEGNIKALRGIEKHLNYLKDEQCKFIIAISESSFNIQKKILSFYPKYEDVILSKMKVINPPQRVLLNSIHEKDKRKKINFCLIGRDLLGKGGGEVIKVFNNLSKSYTNFHLFLIGKINLETENSNDYSITDLNNFLSIVRKNSVISHYENMPNKDFLHLIKNKIDIGLLPTRSDTYGYSVLEFQAAGCPVISTDLRALREINSEDIGWLIKVKQNYFGESFHFTSTELSDLRESIEKQLQIIVTTILNSSKEVIELKGEKCLKKINKNHSLKRVSKMLLEIYNKTIL